jgi:superfamily II DNA or RNA helicase
MIQLYSYEDDYIVLPPNPSYIDFDLDIDDRRVAPYIESPKADITLKEHQIEWDKQLEEFDYNAVLESGTGTGKSFFLLYLQNKLQGPMLFVASQTSFLINFKNEVIKFYGDDSLVTMIDTKWDGKPTPFMLISVQLLNMRKDIQEKLSEQCAIVACDEIHKLSGEQFREAIQSVKPKYRIGLSATPIVKARNFTQACFSANFVKTPDTNIVPISVLSFHLQFDPSYDIMGGDFMARKKAYTTNKRFVRSLTDAVEHIVKDRKRHCLVYSDLGEAQRAYKKAFDSVGIKSVIVNKDSSREEVTKILKDFEAGKIDVVVSGKMMVESISLFKLSVIIMTTQMPTDSFGGRNSLLQLLGRSRRFNREVCGHSKIFIDLTFSSFEKYYTSRVPVYKEVQGVKVLNQIKSENTDFAHYIKRG